MTDVNRAMVEGVLWLERHTLTPTVLEWRYTEAPNVAAARLASGRLRFRALDDGGWIVSDWRVRTPARQEWSVDMVSPVGNVTERHFLHELGSVVTHAVPRESGTFIDAEVPAAPPVRTIDAILARAGLTLAEPAPAELGDFPRRRAGRPADARPAAYTRTRGRNVVGGAP